MPLCNIYLFALNPVPGNSISNFLSALKSHGIAPLVISRVIRWIILPEKLSTEHLLARNIHWDILLILPASDSLPLPLTTLIQHQWKATAGVPSRLLENFAARNKKLLHPDTPHQRAAQTKKSEEPPPIADSSQNLELSEELNTWIEAFYTNGGARGHGAVSMLNLLSFNPGMKPSYLQYGKAFSESIGSRHGGNAKIVGTVTQINGMATAKMEGGGSDETGQALWDEVALAHYPSILHFRDMLASRDYQVVNKEYRVPALRDTFILMTSEIDVEGDYDSGFLAKGKL